MENLIQQNGNDVDPNQQWEQIKDQVNVQKVQMLQDPNVPKKPGHLRFVCLSDTHCNDGCFQNVPDGDVLLHAGDFTYTGKTAETQHFVNQLNSLPHPTKIVIAGNHEIPFDVEKWKTQKQLMMSNFGIDDVQDPLALKQLVIDNCTYYLEDSGTPVSIGGYRIWGSPWSPFFYNWGFNALRGEDIKARWDKIPNDTDILITHGPPLGYGDKCTHGGLAGCYDLLDAIRNRIKPMYHIFGHIHEGYGVLTDGTTTYINASSVNEQYQSVNAPIVFDLPIKEGQPGYVQQE